MDKTQQCVEAYRRLKNLKLVGIELGIPWQTIYVHLKRANEPVTGDKARYGSASDQLALRGESLFKQLVPSAVGDNEKGWQPKVDFHVGALGIDVKTALLRRGSWAFSVKKQRLVADHFVCFAFEGDELRHTLLLPREIVEQYATIRFAVGNKWQAYEVEPTALATFFISLSQVAA